MPLAAATGSSHLRLRGRMALRGAMARPRPTFTRSPGNRMAISPQRVAEAPFWACAMGTIPADSGKARTVTRIV